MWCDETTLTQSTAEFSLIKVKEEGTKGRKAAGLFRKKLNRRFERFKKQQESSSFVFSCSSNR